MKTLSFLLITFIIGATIPANNTNQQQNVLQTVLNIKEFQDYLSYVPRYVGSNNKQNILMLASPTLENTDLQLTIRDRTVEIINAKQAKALDNEIFIKINDFSMQQSTAEVVLSYQNARMYFDTNQKVRLEAHLKKTKTNQWTVEKYKLSELNINTSD